MLTKTPTQVITQALTEWLREEPDVEPIPTDALFRRYSNYFVTLAEECFKAGEWEGASASAFWAEVWARLAEHTAITAREHAAFRKRQYLISQGREMMAHLAARIKGL